ncbi:MAG: DUF547 domain-containing protein [Pseudomonadota bacterium]
MPMRLTPWLTGCAAILMVAGPVAANTSETAFAAAVQADTGGPYALFAPDDDRTAHTIDYRHWDEALSFFVIPMGPSLREGAPRVEPGTGTRIVYGHRSRFRLEGNRIAFSFLDEDVQQSLTDYRRDLERVGNELDLTRLPRNEQLAFWLNLHNVAVVEAIAQEYPLRDPAEGAFGTNKAGLQDAKLVTVKGVELSPRDIRERIVYPNWRDPKVLYGFWRGEIGGPSIQRVAFTGENVDVLLALSAEEFVNSLRGIEAYGGSLRLSPIYRDAEPFFFQDESALREHLNTYAREDVKGLLSSDRGIAYKRYESDIADLLYGRGDPGINFVCTQLAGEFGFLLQAPSVQNCSDQRTVPNRALQRLIEERSRKLNKAYRRGIRTGMVIFGDGQYAEGDAPKEVE